MNVCPERIDQKQGIEGSILGFPLADVLQLKQQNHFSGCVRVTSGGVRPDGKKIAGSRFGSNSDPGLKAPAVCLSEWSRIK